MLTVDSLLKTIEAMKVVNEAGPAYGRMADFKITPSALCETTERLFPASKNRSRRIHKKLIKRFGGEFRKKPAAYMFNGEMFCHPSIYKQLEQFKAITTPPSSPQHGG